MDTRSPLDIPEIVANVLQFSDRHTLSAAAQVNSLWVEEAINICKPMLAVAGGHRRLTLHPVAMEMAIQYTGQLSLSASLRKLHQCCRNRERLDWWVPIMYISLRRLMPSRYTKKIRVLILEGEEVGPVSITDLISNEYFSFPSLR